MFWLNSSGSWTCRVNGEGELQPTLDLCSVLFLQERFFLHVADIILCSQQEISGQIQLRCSRLAAGAKPSCVSHFTGTSFAAFCFTAFVLLSCPFFPHHSYSSPDSLNISQTHVCLVGLAIAQHSSALPLSPPDKSHNLHLLPLCCLQKDYVHCTKVSCRLNQS